MLQELEQKYNFQYPTLYKELHKDGMLNWGEFGPNWYKSVYPKIKDNPPLLLYGRDFEILPIGNIEEEIQGGWFNSDYQKLKPEFKNKFIPFAQSGGGDLYCFYLDESKEDFPIVFIYHDANEAYILADNLQDFIFRELIETITDPSSDALFEDNRYKQLNSHKKYLKKEQELILTEIYKRPSLRKGHLLEEKDAQKIIKQEIGFADLDKCFECFDYDF